MRTMMVFLFAHALVSCSTPGGYREVFELDYCIEMRTPMKISYYLCEDPLSYCYVSDGGLSCFLKDIPDDDMDNTMAVPVP